MGDDSRSRRILADLSSALRRDPKIDEFDFIYCPEPVVNKSPVVLENHKLGLQTWSVKLLFNFVYTNLMKKTAAVKDLKSLHEFSCAVLLLNPECYTIWNSRKELVTKRYIKAEDDLKLATIIQTKHPKSPETFIQRRWLLLQLFPSNRTTTTSSNPTHLTHHQANGNSPHNQHHSNGSPAHPPGSASQHLGSASCPQGNASQHPRITSQLQGNASQPPGSASQHPRSASGHSGSASQHQGSASNPPGTASHHDDAFELTERHRQVVEREMDACRVAADRYPSNYNAWSHRIWVLREIARLDTRVLLDELESTKLWVRQHVSDHSGFNYRYFLIKSLFCNQSHEDLLRITHEELVFTSSLIHSFPGHEAIWYHRRSILTFGRECMKRTEGGYHASHTPNSLNFAERVVEGANGVDLCEDISDTEPLVQGEKEWLLLKDFSSAGSFPDPKTSSSKMDSTDYLNECAEYERATSCADDQSIENALAMLLCREDLFMDALYKKTCKADRPQLQRCIDSHRRWLSHVQY